MSSKVLNFFESAGFGVLMVVIFCLIYFISTPFVKVFMGNIREFDQVQTSTVLTTVYIMLLILSPQVWFFSTLYFFDRNKK